jgi:pimeloyl-ACP methyl ester carboxylesterase
MRAGWVVAVAVLAGCNGLSLKKADGGPVLDTVRSALRLHAPGPFAQDYLVRRGFPPGVTSRPAVYAEQLANDTTAEGRLVLAELCDLAGREAEVWSPGKAVGHYLDAAWHAERAMLDDPEALTAERRGEAAAIYNHAVGRFLRRTAGRKLRTDADWERRVATHGAAVTVRRDDAVWHPDPFDEFRFADDFVALGVPDRKRSGLGVPLLAVRKRWWRDPERQAPPQKFFPPLQVYPVTAVVRFERPTGLGRPPALLELHDPLRYDDAAFSGYAVPLAADLTTPLVYQVTGSDLDRLTYLGLFDPQREQHKTGLFLTHPYEPGKIPVVLIHGLWSSPKTWTRVINDLRADPLIRDRYQFWTFQYPTGNPFIHCAAQLRQALAEVRTAFDPGAQDPAFDQMVLVGHSMGGLITKTMIARSEDRVWRLISPRPFDELKAPPDERDRFRSVFFFEPVPCVKRAVFVAVPHRGSMLGSNWLGQLGDRLIRRPNVLTDAHKVLLEQNSDSFFTVTFLQGIPSSIRTLRTHSPLLTAVDALPVSPGVPRHSIIARVAPVPLPLSTDGVVPYESSHIDGVESEKVVTGSHACLDQADVIDELRRILVLHLQSAGR